LEEEVRRLFAEGTKALRHPDVIGTGCDREATGNGCDSGMKPGVLSRGEDGVSGCGSVGWGGGGKVSRRRCALVAWG
jgi:hypothetical protein